MTVTDPREGGWVVARGRKTRKAAVRCSSGQSKDVKPTSNEEQAMLKAKLKQATRIVSGSAFYENVLKLLGPPSDGYDSLRTQPALPRIQRVVLWGLGSLRQARASHIQCQLALLCLLRDELCPWAAAEAVDPAFSPADIALLAFKDIQVLEENRQVAATPTLFFLAHCGAALTESLLRANLEAGTLGNVVLLGNSLTSVAEALGRRPARDRQEGDGAPTLCALCSGQHAGWTTHELLLPELGFDVVSAFNDFALHTFHPSTVLAP